MAVAFGISWVTMVGHNLFELPLTPVDIENEARSSSTSSFSWPTGGFRRRAVYEGAILCWALLTLVIGGVVSVLPLAALPFQPEQSTSHYLAHVVYALGQVPLVLLAVTALRHRPPSAPST